MLLASNKEIETGQKPQDCANDIFRAVLRGDNEIIPLKYLSGAWLRNFFPSVYFWFMELQARALEARNEVPNSVVQ